MPEQPSHRMGEDEPKRDYESPRIQRLGSLGELTRSNQAGQDDTFMGTGGDQAGPQPQFGP